MAKAINDREWEIRLQLSAYAYTEVASIYRIILHRVCGVTDEWLPMKEEYIRTNVNVVEMQSEAGQVGPFMSLRRCPVYNIYSFSGTTFNDT